MKTLKYRVALGFLQMSGLPQDASALVLKLLRGRSATAPPGTSPSTISAKQVVGLEYAQVLEP